MHSVQPLAMSVERQRVDKVPSGLHPAAVLDHVDFEEAGRRIAPVAERAHRHLSTNDIHHGAAPAVPVGARTSLAQRTINSRRTDLQQPLLDQRIQLQMTVPLHGIDEDRNQWLEPLAAHAVAGFPQHDECLANRFIVETVARGPGPLLQMFSGQDPYGVLAVVPGQRHELIEDRRPLPCSRLPVARANGLCQLLACCHADSPLPRHVMPPSDHPTGSKIREATGSSAVANLMSQCARARLAGACAA